MTGCARYLALNPVLNPGAVKEKSSGLSPPSLF